MTEYRLFAQGETPYVSTPEFHSDRERAPHLEQPIHRDRLNKAFDFVISASAELIGPEVTLSDLGCGDGGLLSLIKRISRISAWGYDFHAPSQDGWLERGVSAELLDVFGKDRDRVIFGDIAVCTEVLEHLADPHGVVAWIRRYSQFFVASSPWTETDISHDSCHAWAWDIDGYRQLIEGGGWTIEQHEKVGMFQVVLAKS